jgi:hypothetical protein
LPATRLRRRWPGALYNAIFLDQLDSDAVEMLRLNRLVARLPEAERDGLRPIDLLMLRPRWT